MKSSRGFHQPRVVLRGGSWNNNPENCRSAYRNRNDPGNRNNNSGFRVCFCLHFRLPVRQTQNRRLHGGVERGAGSPDPVPVSAGFHLLAKLNEEPSGSGRHLPNAPLNGITDAFGGERSLPTTPNRKTQRRKAPPPAPFSRPPHGQSQSRSCGHRHRLRSCRRPSL